MEIDVINPIPEQSSENRTVQILDEPRTELKTHLHNQFRNNLRLEYQNDIQLIQNITRVQNCWC